MTPEKYIPNQLRGIALRKSGRVQPRDYAVLIRAAAAFEPLLARIDGLEAERSRLVRELIQVSADKTVLLDMMRAALDAIDA